LTGLGRSADTVKVPGQDGPGDFFLGGHDKMNILPWHRYLLAMWEDAITEECGWHLGIPCKFDGEVQSKFRLTRLQIGIGIGMSLMQADISTSPLSGIRTTALAEMVYH
jgi:hypothetical protein